MDSEARIANFDRLARPYRWLEYLSFGPMLMRCRCEYLAELLACRHALVLGDGDGRFLARLLAAVPELDAHVIDSSAAMLGVLSRRVAAIDAGHRVTIHQVDALDFEPPAGSYDLVVSHFFLDCFDDREAASLIAGIAPHMLPNALWVVSDFAVPVSSGWRIWPSLVARGIVRLLYSIFGLATGLRIRSLPDYSAAMRTHQLIRKAHRPWLSGLLISELWTLNPGRAPAPRSSGYR